jgi:hypothetical protein
MEADSRAFDAKHGLPEEDLSIYKEDASDSEVDISSDAEDALDAEDAIDAEDALERKPKKTAPVEEDGPEGTMEDVEQEIDAMLEEQRLNDLEPKPYEEGDKELNELLKEIKKQEKKPKKAEYPPLL